MPRSPRACWAPARTPPTRCRTRSYAPGSRCRSSHATRTLLHVALPHRRQFGARRPHERRDRLVEEPPDPVDPRDRFAEQELSGELQRARNALDESYRVAVVLYDVLGCSYAEIAEMTRVPEGTVKSRIFRGRSELAERLGTHVEGAESNDDGREASQRARAALLRRGGPRPGARRDVAEHTVACRTCTEQVRRLEAGREALARLRRSSSLTSGATRSSPPCRSGRIRGGASGREAGLRGRGAGRGGGGAGRRLRRQRNAAARRRGTTAIAPPRRPPRKAPETRAGSK